jgi:hypothetical protein
MESEDAMGVMESDTIYCKSVIAGLAQSVSVFHKTLFDILAISCKRPDLEYACFQALERIAAVRNYPTVEDMIDYTTASTLTRSFTS